jgi:hypothetical protein
MRTLAQGIYAGAEIGTELSLPRSGSWLENSFVYDASAREIKLLAERGLVRIVGEQTVVSDDRSLITGLVFIKLG